MLTVKLQGNLNQQNNLKYAHCVTKIANAWAIWWQEIKLQLLLLKDTLRVQNKSSLILDTVIRQSITVKKDTQCIYIVV